MNKARNKKTVIWGLIILAALLTVFSVSNSVQATSAIKQKLKVAGQGKKASKQTMTMPIRRGQITSWSSQSYPYKIDMKLYIVRTRRVKLSYYEQLSSCKTRIWSWDYCYNQ